jgi:hypothetical protein
MPWRWRWWRHVRAFDQRHLVYGPDDDTLFRLVALGSDELKKQGYVRKGSENVVGPMPPFGTIIKTSDDLWKVIAWIRTVNPNSQAKVDKPVQ